MKVSDYHFSLKNYVTRINNHLSSFRNHYLTKEVCCTRMGNHLLGLRVLQEHDEK